MLSSHDIRQKYLDFFQKQGHAIIPSASLLPENDPSTLFTSSGMQPLVPYLLGEKHPDGTRLTNSQKCFRAKDVEEVGDNRHTTFFEMLGNWSLGDYFKHEQIPWIFEFVVQELGLDPRRLYVTVFRGNNEIGVPKDEESVQIWQEVFRKYGIEAKLIENAEDAGMQGGRIFSYDENKNWWSRSGIPSNMPLGEPGGPDTEMFWDFGEQRKLHELSTFKDSPCHVNCDCGRFLEIGNSVFMQYHRTERGFEELSQKNVDFGGGLERMMAAVSDNPDMFQIDLFRPMCETLEALSSRSYEEANEIKRSYRVILDHLRAAVFLMSDGAFPSNKDQGYFVRRLIRRAVRSAHFLGIQDVLCQSIGAKVIETYSSVYPNLRSQESVILSELSQEEEKFRKTLSSGLKELERRVSDLGDGKLIAGQVAFDLYQTYGFPLELTQEIVQERGVAVDLAAFQEEAKKHQELSRKGSEQKFSGGLADHSEATVHGHTATHLLHQALRTVLGEHVFQRGSNITPERIRFDFSHSQKMTPEEIQQVELLVTEQIKCALGVGFEILTVDEAKAKGAIGVFEEKYGEKVKVYSIGDFSREICGGPHVSNTSELRFFRIIKEEAVSSGIRRIKAQVG